MAVDELLKGGGPKAFSRNLRAVRAYMDMDQYELAAKSGVDQATISQLERGHRRPQRRTVKKLATALGVDPTILEG
ncbi:MAG: helix-turn-helix transcriptional regulator [Actinomycetota bacterium]|nr:helix-turn-helix transcriptional regulator [Actinomycetota bacterium]